MLNDKYIFLVTKERISGPAAALCLKFEPVVVTPQIGFVRVVFRCRNYYSNLHSLLLFQ